MSNTSPSGNGNNKRKETNKKKQVGQENGQQISSQSESQYQQQYLQNEEEQEQQKEQKQLITPVQLWPFASSFDQNHFLQYLTTKHQHRQQRQHKQQKIVQLEKQQEEVEDDDTDDDNDPTAKVFKRLKILQQQNHKAHYNSSNSNENNKTDHNNNKFNSPYNCFEIVFAKCQHQPLWPCRILSIEHIPGLKPQQVVYHVKFINDNNVAIVNQRCLLKFNDNTCQEVRKVAVGNKRLVRGIKMAQKILHKINYSNKQKQAITPQLKNIKLLQQFSIIQSQEPKKQTSKSSNLQRGVFQPIILVNNSTNITNPNENCQILLKQTDSNSGKRQQLSYTFFGNDDNDNEHNQNYQTQTQQMVDNNPRLVLQDQFKQSPNVQIMSQQQSTQKQKQQSGQQFSKQKDSQQQQIHSFQNSNSNRQKRIRLKQQHQHRKQQKNPSGITNKDHIPISRNHRSRKSCTSYSPYDDKIKSHPFNIIVETPRIVSGRQMLRKIVLEFQSGNHLSQRTNNNMNTHQEQQSRIINSESEQQQQSQQSYSSPSQQQYQCDNHHGQQNYSIKNNSSNNNRSTINNKKLWKALFHQGNDQTRMEEGNHSQWGEEDYEDKNNENGLQNDDENRIIEVSDDNNDTNTNIILQQQSHYNNKNNNKQIATCPQSIKKTIRIPYKPQPNSTTIQTYLLQYVSDLDRVTRLTNRQTKQQEILSYLKSPLHFIITKYSYESYCNILRLGLKVVRLSERENINERFCMGLKGGLKRMGRVLGEYSGSNKYVHSANKVLGKRLRKQLDCDCDQQPSLISQKEQEKQITDQEQQQESKNKKQ